MPNGFYYAVNTSPAINNVGGGAHKPTGELQLSRYQGVALNVNRQGSDGSLVEFRNDGVVVGSISISGAATAYNTSSDYRLKENITAISSASDTLKRLNPVTFSWKAGGARLDGFIAHELNEVVPEAVHGVKDASEAYGDLVDIDGVLVESSVSADSEVPDGLYFIEKGIRPIYQGIDQSKLIPILTAALQEAIERIQQLEIKAGA